MRAPRFWSNPAGSPGWQARALAPLSWVYARGTAKRVAEPPAYRAKVPVICVGNLHAGGTGKTPTVIALVQCLIALGRSPAILSRGHGGSLETATRVGPKHTADEVGDEPRLMADFAPCYIGADRGETAKMAEADGANVLVMDDGFQNPSLAKDLSIVVVNAYRGFGNGRVLPAGPLREPIDKGLNRANALLSIGEAKAQAQFASHTSLPPHLKHLKAKLEVLQTGMQWQGLPCLAFAGIGYPEQFFETLRSLGADLKRTVPLGDHQPLTPALMARIQEEAKLSGAQLVTTEKDAIRLPQALRAKVLVVPVRLSFEAPAELNTLLTKLLS